jgi:hypothetical protein
MLGQPMTAGPFEAGQRRGPRCCSSSSRSAFADPVEPTAILELHTLGVRTVYSQADVTNFAKVLTGWTIRETVYDPDSCAACTSPGRRA